MLPQALLTLILLRALHINPGISAYAQLHVAFDFNQIPLAPPGTCIVVHENPDSHDPGIPMTSTDGTRYQHQITTDAIAPGLG